MALNLRLGFGGQGGAGGALTGPIAFRASRAAAQTYADGSFTTSSFTGTDFDTDSSFSSDVYTIPARANGLPILFHAGAQVDGLSAIQIERSTNGGSSWGMVENAYLGNISGQLWAVSPFLAATTGHMYRMRGFGLGGSSRLATNQQFSALTFPEGSDFFHATNNTTQAVAALDYREIALQTEITDTASAFASGRYTVQASDNGKYGLFSAGAFFGANLDGSAHIQVSTDGGSSWTDLTQSLFENCASCVAFAGPVLLTTGHIYRFAVFPLGSGTIANNDGTFFSGIVLPDAGDVGRLVRASTNDTYTALTWEAVDYNSEVFDTANMLQVSPDTYTIPAGLGGRYALFAGGVRHGTGVDGTFAITRTSADPDYYIGGQSGSGEFGRNAFSGVVRLTGGETYEGQVNLSAGANNAAQSTFFGYYVAPTT